MQALKAFHERTLATHSGYALLVAFVQSFQRHEPAMLAKQAAYSILYAIPSILLTLVSLAIIVDKNTGAQVSTLLRQAITEQAPDDAQPLLQSLVDNAVVRTSETTAILAAALSFAVAVWGASGGVGALMYAVNRVYDVRDTRSFIKAALLRLGLMLLGGVLVIGAFLLFTLGRRVGDSLPDAIANQVSGLDVVLSGGPFWALPLVFVSLLLLYWVSLDTPKTLRWLLPGAAAATLAVIVMFALLDLILSYSSPAPAFGAAGGVIVLLWTLFVLSQFVVVGALLNAVLAHRYDQKFRAALERHPDKRRSTHEMDKRAEEHRPEQGHPSVAGEVGAASGGASDPVLTATIAGAGDRAGRRSGIGDLLRRVRAGWRQRVRGSEPALLLLRIMAGISLLAQAPQASTRRTRERR